MSALNREATAPNLPPMGTGPTPSWLTLPGAVMGELDLRVSLSSANFSASVTLSNSPRQVVIRPVVLAWCLVREVYLQAASPGMGPCLFMGASTCIELTDEAASALRQWLTEHGALAS